MPQPQLTMHERYVITHLHMAGFTPAAIGRRLGRHRGTVGRELARNRDGWGGYRAGYLTVQVKHVDANAWEQRVSLGLAGDTLTMVRAVGSAWRVRPRATPVQVGVVLTHLVPEASATQPLFVSQSHLDALAEAMDAIDTRYGRHTIYFGGMWGAAITAPTRISFTQIPTLEEFS